MTPIGPTFWQQLFEAGLSNVYFTIDSNNDIHFLDGTDPALMTAVTALWEAYIAPLGGWLTDARNIVLDSLKLTRDNKRNGGFTYGGNTYRSDSDSQREIIVQAALRTAGAEVPEDFTIMTADSVAVVFTGPQIIELLKALNDQTARIMAQYYGLEALVLASMTPEVITWPEGDAPPIVNGLGSIMVNVPVAVASIPSSAEDIGAATAQQGALADSAVQPLALNTALAARSPKLFTATAVGSGLIVEIDISSMGLTVAPSAITSLQTMVGSQTYYAEIVAGATATRAYVRVWRSRGTLLLTSGPFELAPAGSVATIVVTP